MKVKIPWIKLLFMLLPAIRRGIAAVEDAVAADSKEGEKVTIEESLNIAEAIWNELKDPLVQLILEANKA
tara:strand:- start:246 stop:455 length:210 start_codon:yes stop_codon:yes gene_type:complete